MKQRDARKLVLKRETIARLDGHQMAGLMGGTEKTLICSGSASKTDLACPPPPTILSKCDVCKESLNYLDCPWR